MSEKMFRLPLGLKHPHKPPKSEKGTNAGRSAFVVICSNCPPGTTGTANQYGADVTSPPIACPKGHPLPQNGWIPK